MGEMERRHCNGELEECEQYTTYDDLVRQSMVTGSLTERSALGQSGQIEQTVL